MSDCKTVGATGKLYGADSLSTMSCLQPSMGDSPLGLTCMYGPCLISGTALLTLLPAVLGHV